MMLALWLSISLITPDWTHLYKGIQQANWLVSKGADITNCLPGTSVAAIHIICYYSGNGQIQIKVRVMFNSHR